jgi:hypothetical protein
MPVGACGKHRHSGVVSPIKGNSQVERGGVNPPAGNRQVERGSAGNTWNQVEKGSTNSAKNNEVDRIGGAGRDRL